MRRFILIVFILSVNYVDATHLVGGEISYTCTGNNQYQIRLRIYRDCGSTSNALFDPNAVITIFNATGNVVQNMAVPRGTIHRLPATVNNPCLQSPPNVCTEYTDYVRTVTLPANPGGYTITHQRCCRNNTIDNVPNSGDWGNTYTVTIPPNDACNSAPIFTTSPPIVMCLNDTLDIDASVVENDGDSLVYALCDPLHGGGTTAANGCLTCPAPSPAGAPPYTNVPFIPGRSATDPMPANPAIQIDPVTGRLSGVPTSTGQYVFAICVYEYRNGVLQSTVRRDYQFNVVSCQSNVVSRIISQIDMPGSLCSGLTMNFEENAINGDTYFWDFGDPSTLADTSNQPNPTYTYSDTGSFVVTLIVNRGYPCADTATDTFKINYPLSFTILTDGDVCFDQQGFEFSVLGSFSSNAIFDWSFPPEADITSDNNPQPPPVTFNAPGSYPVSLTIRDFGCTFTYNTTVDVYTRPQFYADPYSGEVCSPYELDVGHSAISNETVQYRWVFGDGTTSTQANPEKTYSAPGTYNGSLLMYTSEGCIDSAYYTWSLDVLPSPNVNITLTPTSTDIFEPFVEIRLTGMDPTDTYTVYTGDGVSYANQSIVHHRYFDIGTYEIRVEITNDIGCTSVRYASFLVTPVELIYVPSAFSPNGDRVNDRFKSYSSGYRTFDLSILDRWGNVVFQSNDADEWWDGTGRNNGAPCPVGTYLWVIQFESTEGEVIEKKGTVTLFR